MPLFDSLYNFAHWLTRNREEADDLVQETYAKALKGFHRFQPGTNFRAWFLKILTNLFFQRYRKQQREPEQVDLQEAPDLYLFGQMSEAGLLARSQDPNSGDSQFFFNLKDNHFLDGNYCVFGKVTKGLDVMDKIRQGDKIKSFRVEAKTKPKK